LSVQNDFIQKHSKKTNPMNKTHSLIIKKRDMRSIHMGKKNMQFYKNCTKYFEFLRKKGNTDYNFEDEYYFTMPAISDIGK
jgi:hypothetical protein